MLYRRSITLLVMGYTDRHAYDNADKNECYDDDDRYSFGCAVPWFRLRLGNVVRVDLSR